VASPRRPGAPAIVVASSQKIRAELGWKPEKPDLETMISDAWNWIKVHSHESSQGLWGIERWRLDRRRTSSSERSSAVIPAEVSNAAFT
jgi:hypothetical protein